MSHIPGHVSLVSRVDRVLSKENMDACAQIRKIAVVICSTSCISHLWYTTERERVHKNRYEASGIDTSSNSGARGWTSFKRNILYAIRSLKINGVEINRSVCRRRIAAVPDASTRAFTLQREPDAYRSRPLRTPPDVV